MITSPLYWDVEGAIPYRLNIKKRHNGEVGLFALPSFFVKTLDM